MREFRKCKANLYQITMFSIRLVSVADFTNIRTYSRKTNKLQNIYTIGRGAKNISIKKREILQIVSSCDSCSVWNIAQQINHVFSKIIHLVM